MELADYLSALESRFAGSRYRLQHDVALADDQRAALTAHRTAFSWKGLVWLSHHIVVVQKDDPTPADFMALFDAGFALGKQVNKVPLLRGLQFGYLIVPVIAATRIDPEIIAWVRSRPRKRFSLFEFPVLVDLATGGGHFYPDTPAWGGAFFSDLRKLARTYLTEK